MPLNQIKTIVEEVLAEDPRTRNDDLWLIIAVWQKKQHIDCFIPYDRLREMISPESIRRVRQKIQNEENRFPPTDPKILTRRRRKEQKIREWALDGTGN